MNRRYFIKSTALATGVSILASQTLLASKNNPFGVSKDIRKFNVTNDYDMKYNGNDTRLWIPLPLDANYQKSADIKYNGNYDEAKIVTNPYNAKVLYAKWHKTNKQNRKLNLTFNVSTIERTVRFSKAKNSTNYPEDVKKFLNPTEHIPVDDKVKKFLAPIIKGSTSPLQKARAIYNWTSTTMYRDPKTIGCGLGDAKRAIQEKIFGGKCTDISSVFVSLLRNAGIPAREVFGIRLGKSYVSKALGKSDENYFGNFSKGQHCKAEFYIDGIGWVPADPADVTKIRLVENLANNNDKVQKAREYFFGSWEMNWIGFNSARDFILDPKPTQFPINMLGYPYSEDGEDVLNYYDPKSFKYSYTAKEIK